jgi:Ca2+-binding EF-hand superfamily protein
MQYEVVLYSVLLKYARVLLLSPVRIIPPHPSHTLPETVGTTMVPIGFAATGLVLLLSGIGCITVLDLDLDGVYKRNPALATRHFTLLWIMLTCFGGFLGNTMWVATTPIYIYFLVYSSQIIDQEETAQPRATLGGYRSSLLKPPPPATQLPPKAVPKMTEMLSHFIVMVQVGFGGIFIEMASNRFKIYTCWCFLPHLQKLGFLDKFHTDPSNYEMAAHLATSSVFFIGSMLTYWLHRDARCRGLTPTKRLFMSGYMCFCTVGISMIVMIACIQFVQGYTVPWGSRFKHEGWTVLPLFILITSIAQLRYIFRSGNSRTFRAGSERKNWHDHSFPNDPPRARIAWPAVREIFGYGFSSPSGLIAHGVYDMLIKKGNSRNKSGDAASGADANNASNKGSTWCICLVCTPLYFLLIDLLFVPFMLLSGCCCGNRQPYTEQEVNEDFLRNHPNLVNDGWARKHPEAVPSHKEAQKIWRRYSKRNKALELGMDGRYELEKFCLKRSQVLQRLVRYVRYVKEKQTASADAMDMDMSWTITHAQYLHDEGQEWIGRITDNSEPQRWRQEEQKEEEEEPSSPLRQKLLRSGLGTEDSQVSIQINRPKGAKEDSFEETFVRKSFQFKDALDRCIATKYPGDFSAELLLVLDKSSKESAARKAEELSGKEAMHCPICNVPSLSSDLVCSECSTSLGAGAAALQAAVRAAAVVGAESGKNTGAGAGGGAGAGAGGGKFTSEFTTMQSKNIGQYQINQYYEKLQGVVVSIQLGAVSGEGFVKVQKLGSAGIDSVRELFRKFDTDGSTTLDKSEMSEVIAALRGGRVKPEDVDSAMHAMDADGDGSVDEREFIRWWIVDGSLVQQAPNHTDKFSMNVDKFKFGKNDVFAGGLMSFISDKDLRRSIETECRENSDKDNKYYDDYKYVVFDPAREQETRDPATGKVRHKDKGHAGKTLDDFTEEVQRRCPKIKKAHIAVARLYTGALYRPWNSALRALIDVDTNPDAKKELLKWATCIAVLYEALIILSFETKEECTVWRGVDETHMSLPDKFTKNKGGGFAGGVEMAFMSTTKDPQIALDFSGGPDKRGSIFEIKFTGASRGVDVHSFSLWPEEHELLYAPFTYLTCQDTQRVDNKTLIKLDATMSTARPNLDQMNLDNCAATPPQPCAACQRPVFQTTMTTSVYTRADHS